MNLNDLISKNQIFALTAKALEGSKVIITNLLIARFFEPDDFGRYSFILGITSLLAVIAEFRLQNVLVKEITCDSEPPSRLLGSALVANLIFAVIGILLVLAYSAYESDKTVAIGLAIYSISFLYKIPRTFRAQFLAEEKNILIAKCEIAASMATLSITLAFIAYEFSLLWIVFARSIDFLAIGILLTYYHKKNTPLKISYKSSTAKRLINLSAPLVFSGAAMILFQRLDIILVRHYLGDFSAGIYSSATTLMLMFSITPIVVSETLAPKMFKNINLENYPSVKQKFSDIIVTTGMAMSALMFTTAYFATTLIFGESYQDAKIPALILSITPLLTALGAASGQIIVADGNQNRAFIKSVVACIINTILNIALIPKYGIHGAAMSTVIGLFIANYAAHFFMDIYKYLFIIQSKSLFLPYKPRTQI
ncbi:flippase [Pseudomonas sp. TCU-HL1]|uniref:flippase n=1 Tax=Pseudomonas sp. TCU-HL1 TaxID=1856685 RepID=UPI00083CE211|nr:flippase [Pseudomonas sp. TCU-HL1]AOE83350.1 hypothetical protein THL1_802 [Pseudomonas sp. TCU-HL1]